MASATDENGSCFILNPSTKASRYVTCERRGADGFTHAIDTNMKALLAAIGWISLLVDATEDGVSFHCIGNCHYLKPPRKRRGGNAMMGGHMYPGVAKASDNLPYAWFLDRVDGGDILVLTADNEPCDIYNKFFYSQVANSTRPNSVTTACFTSRNGSFSKKLQRLLNNAAGVFLTGGDQAKYYEFWRHSPVSETISNGILLGGSSAGLAVQGRFAFAALHGSLSSEDALKYPTDESVTVVTDFLTVDKPWMRHVLTDTHFLQRDRMGRLMVFLARVRASNASEDVVGFGISEHTSVLVDDESGTATFVGDGPAYVLVTSNSTTPLVEEGSPLRWGSVIVWRWTSNLTSSPRWDFRTQRPLPADESFDRYEISCDKGRLRSTQRGGSIY